MPVDGKCKLGLVFRVFHHLEASPFGRELPLVLFRIEFALVEQWFATNERGVEQTNAMLTKFGESEVKTSNRILGLLRDLKESFVRSSEEQKNEPQEHIHRHSFDIKSNKVFSLLVGMGIVCSLSIWGNIELWKSKRQYADDALKFRVIRSWGGCNANHILWLNDVFDIHRNEKAIEWIQQEADCYDKGLKTLSDSLMQEKLKNVH